VRTVLVGSLDTLVAAVEFVVDGGAAVGGVVVVVEFVGIAAVVGEGVFVV